MARQHVERLGIRLIGSAEVEPLNTEVIAAQGDATQAIADAGSAQGDATQAIADAGTAQNEVDALQGKHWYFTLTAGTENGTTDTIPVTLTIYNDDNSTNQSVRSFVAHLYNNNGVAQATAAYTIAVSTNGTSMDSANTQARVYFSNLGTGTVSLAVADVGGTSTQKIWLQVDPLDATGQFACSVRAPVQFA